MVSLLQHQSGGDDWEQRGAGLEKDPRRERKMFVGSVAGREMQELAAQL